MEPAGSSYCGVRGGFETYRQDRAADTHALPRVGEAPGHGQHRGSRHLRLAFGAHLGESAQGIVHLHRFRHHRRNGCGFDTE